jgi:hypothetical protein
MGFVALQFSLGPGLEVEVQGGQGVGKHGGLWLGSEGQGLCPWTPLRPGALEPLK